MEQACDSIFDLKVKQSTFLEITQAGHSSFKTEQDVLTSSGVNVAVLRNERAGGRACVWRAAAPSVVGSHHQYQQQLEPRARAHCASNPNQYHIFATLPTSEQFPLLFWPTLL
jgi:hypothetical protein